MNVTLWIVQGLLAFAFIAFGGMKLFAYEKFKVMSEKNGPTGITRGLTTFSSIAELAGVSASSCPTVARQQTSTAGGVRLPFESRHFA